MKIALACSQFPPTKSGYSRISFELYERFRKLGHEVDLVTEGGRGCSRGFGRMAVLDSIGKTILEKDHDVLQIIGPTPRFSEQCANFVRENKPDTKIVYTVNAFPGLASYHDNALTRAVDWAYKELSLKKSLKRVDVAVFNTEDYARFYKYYKGKYHVIPYGYDGIAHDESSPTNRLTRNRTNARKNILYVGQLRPYKGLPYLIRALKEVRDLGYDAHLDIVGEGSDAKTLVKLADEIGVADRVSIHEEVPDAELSSMYLNADVFVLPSISEPESFGIVLVEAASYGVPIVASGLPGVRELAMSLGSIVVSPRDSHELARAIVSSFSKDRVSLTGNFHQFLSRFAWESIAKEYIALYESLLPITSERQSIPVQNLLGVEQ